MVAAPTAAAAPCPDVEVVFARGTGEPAGIGVVGESFVDKLENDMGGKSVSTYAVNYPASYDFLAAADGANDASAHVQGTVAACPGTAIVLGGYSQGAAVIDAITAAPGPALGFTNVMPPQIADHVAAVAVFGNPSDRIGLPLTAVSPLYGAKTIDLCTVGDPICSVGDDRAAHSLYVQSGMTSQAATFAAQRLSATAPQTLA
ncbi:cutinase [Mycolicibacterium litorale]|uniref:Cutinase n=1 Tax=Mycolicibacterium litorale TaxID=758802 RepID=A0AAD1MW83_9MYCO|nr:cutinase [Mycolicibacterium litorale]